MSFVIVDFSHLANCCWYPAVAAEEAGQKAFTEHCMSCDYCALAGKAECQIGKGIAQYDARLVLKTNLMLKLDTIKDAVKVHPNKWIFVKDGHAIAKFNLFPAYKGNRDRSKFDPRYLAERYLRSLTNGARWFISKDNEADDTIAALAMATANQGAEVIVVSGDKDLWQLLQFQNIRIFGPTKKEFIGQEQIEKAFGTKDPRHIVLCKSLWGDSGDNIPNAVPRMQKQLMPIIEASDGTLSDFLAKTELAQLTARCKQLLKEGLAQVSINHALVKLSDEVVPEPVQEEKCSQ